MLQLSQCKVAYTEDSAEAVRKRAAKMLRIRPESIKNMRIVKKSLDARKKPQIYFIYTVCFEADQEEHILRKNRHMKNLLKAREKSTLVEQRLAAQENYVSERKRETIVIVGAGPAGLFCGYYLGLCGFRPIILERGAPMEERTQDVEKFWRQGILCPESNVSFGEGGAGTFSDGKLNTGVSDKTGRKKFILESFVKFGAGEDILYESKPHIGTDVLRGVIVNMREEMKRLGCEFHFHTKMTGLCCEGGAVRGVQTESPAVAGERQCAYIPCDRLVLAIGHSARDTFFMLHEAGVAMSPKPFAVGVRVQHRQEDIDQAQYGISDRRLPASPYKCTGRTSDGRGVYSFCMCPGGYVVNASSEEGGLTVNGMSDAGRDSGNANSAIVVSVEPEDFGGGGCLAGIEFQRKWERAAFEMCGGDIPVQRYGDFLADRTTACAGRVKPCVKGKWSFGNLRKALPNFVINGMIDGMEQFSRKISGFAHEDTLLLGIETRTSSPVRIDRDEEFVSLAVKGLYPCGEGAGYAGGIMSAAMDGMRIAMKIQDLQD